MLEESQVNVNVEEMNLKKNYRLSTLNSMTVLVMATLTVVTTRSLFVRDCRERGDVQAKTQSV